MKPQTKVCLQCSQRKPLSAYNRTLKDGIATICRACHGEQEQRRMPYGGRTQRKRHMNRMLQSFGNTGLTDTPTDWSE